MSFAGPAHARYLRASAQVENRLPRPRRLGRPYLDTFIARQRGVRLRQMFDPADLARITAMESTVWSMDSSWLLDDWTNILKTEPDGLEIFAVESAGAVVSAAWIRYVRDTDFAMLWGGSTLSEWRGRGLYRALVAHRARRAVERGVRYLEVDASEDSRPILQRLGFTAVTTTRPYVWTPPAAS